MLMAELGPLWVGALADRTGGYDAQLLVTAGGPAVAILLFRQLPKAQARSC